MRDHRQLGLKGIDDLTSFGELVEEFAEEFDIPEEYRETETPWFEPREGLDWIGTIRRHIESNPLSVTEPDQVLTDLGEYERLLEKASDVGARWHFQMDV